jgi:hypothetical protein
MRQARGIKKHRTYTIGEMALQLGVHGRTVRRWLAMGLRCCREGRPILILGCDLFDFLSHQRAHKKRKCNDGQLYCVACRMAKEPAGKMVEFIQRSRSAGLLRAICPDCDRFMHRGTSLAKLEQVARNLDVTFARGQRRLEDRSPALVDVTFGRAA